MADKIEESIEAQETVNTHLRKCKFNLNNAHNRLLTIDGKKYKFFFTKSFIEDRDAYREEYPEHKGSYHMTKLPNGDYAYVIPGTLNVRHLLKETYKLVPLL